MRGDYEQLIDSVESVCRPCCVAHNNPCIACRVNGDEPDATGLACDLEYDHVAEVLDVGAYRFKGISFDFHVKSVNIEALRGRNEGFQGDIKASKAAKTSEGTGFEGVRVLVLLS